MEWGTYRSAEYTSDVEEHTFTYITSLIFAAYLIARQFMAAIIIILLGKCHR